MKNIYSLLLAIGCASTGVAQTGSEVPRWQLEINSKAGAHTYSAKPVNFAGNYLNSMNAAVGEVAYTPGSSKGYDLRVGYFVGEKASFGLGVGFLYLQQSANATLDKFYIEYQSRDVNGELYRQVLKLKAPIKEEITSTNINIPVVLKYRTNLSKTFGFDLDAGIVYNLSMRNKYTTNASFNYESIYKLVRASDGRWESVYDASVTPASVSWRITADELQRTKPYSEVEAEFAQYRAQGYNVGLDQKPTRSTAYKSYKSGSVGFLIQPSVSFSLSREVSIRVGGYYMYQTFKVPGVSSYQLTSLVGSYTSIMGAQQDVKMQNYGGSIGLGFNL